MEQILKRLEQYNELKSNLSDEVKNYIQNKNNSLKDRWKLFTTAKLGKNDSFLHRPNGIDWNEMTLHDDFYMEKYSIIDAEDFIELCQNILSDNEEEDEKITIDIDAVKEYFIDNFLWSFKFDW